MEMFHYLIRRCSGSENFALVKADMIPQLLNILNPVSLSFADCQEIHTCLVYAIYISFWLATPGGLANLEIEDDDGQQAVHKIVLKKVFAPSETYICHLCKNHCSIIDGAQSAEFLTLLAYLLQRYPSCQHTMDIVLQMPVVFTIPSCLTFFEHDNSIWTFLSSIMIAQQGWNTTREDQRQLWKNVQRMLRMEGIEDVFEEKLQNDMKTYLAADTVATLFDWNNLQGMNLPTLW
ncbi:hypothetical protein BLNAU_18025 [Blattamonas nauphoetae]|uniref:Uncharacterized protein n=1 Tax=Blattamonas nauphoetae TaxID=2049346 RepID=A0ABQ9X5Z8_9EUKA|nr:hypothetical protein BLNAU_18025 [Blattamonas nauphoetae]